MSVWHTEQEREIALEEYRQGNELVRHYDTIDWVVGSIFIPISMSLFGLSYTDIALRHAPTSIIALFVGSIAIFLLWLMLDQRFGYYCQIAYKRLRALERDYGMDLHEKINREDHQQSCRSVKRASFWIWVFFVLLLSAWILRIFSMIHISISWY